MKDGARGRSAAVTPYASSGQQSVIDEYLSSLGRRSRAGHGPPATWCPDDDDTNAAARFAPVSRLNPTTSAAGAHIDWSARGPGSGQASSSAGGSGAHVDPVGSSSSRFRHGNAPINLGNHGLPSERDPGPEQQLPPDLDESWDASRDDPGNDANDNDCSEHARMRSELDSDDDPEITGSANDRYQMTETDADRELGQEEADYVYTAGSGRSFPSRRRRPTSRDADGERIHDAPRPSRSLVSSSVPSSSSSSTSRQRLKPVTFVRPEHQAAFGFPAFNAMQSEVFDDAYLSQKSLVVAAPTGAGKTVVMDLVLLQHLERQKLAAGRDVNPDNDAPSPGGGFRGGAARRDCEGVGRGKAIYLAPLKALCQERAADWKRRIPGLRIAELTSDEEGHDGTRQSRLVSGAQLVLATPEKLDAVTRHNGLLAGGPIGLLLIDEIHLLGSPDRGPCLEGVVTRLRLAAPAARVVAISATLPNAGDLARWLGAEARVFGPEYRPVPLETVITGFPARRNLFLFERGLTYKLPAVLSEYSSGKPSLVFCRSRQNCVVAATRLVEAGVGSGPLSERDRRERLAASAKRVHDQDLRRLLALGVGVHTAGLSSSDRREVEARFRAGDLAALCATTTLALGVNLPCRLVVVMGTQQYQRGLGYVSANRAELLQMTGRAGRPGLDSQGVAVVLCQSGEEDAVMQLLDGPGDPLDSALLARSGDATSYVNAQAAMGMMAEPGGLGRWMRATFAWARATTTQEQDRVQRRVRGEVSRLLAGRMVAPAAGGASASSAGSGASAGGAAAAGQQGTGHATTGSSRSSNTTTNNNNGGVPGVHGDENATVIVDSEPPAWTAGDTCAPHQGAASDVVLSEPAGARDQQHPASSRSAASIVAADGGIVATALGKLMARHGLRFETAYRVGLLRGDEDAEKIFCDVICGAQEFRGDSGQQFSFRMGEKTPLNQANKGGRLRFPVKGRLQTGHDKVRVLLQATMVGEPVPGVDLSGDTQAAFPVAVAVARCVQEYLADLAEGALERHEPAPYHAAMLAASTLRQCLEARQWETEPEVRQLPGVGTRLAAQLSAAGAARLADLVSWPAARLDAAAGRHPPFGANLLAAASSWPRFAVAWLARERLLTVRVEIPAAANQRPYAWFRVLVGGARNGALLSRRWQARDGAEWNLRLPAGEASYSVWVAAEQTLGFAVKRVFDSDAPVAESTSRVGSRPPNSRADPLAQSVAVRPAVGPRSAEQRGSTDSRAPSGTVHDDVGAPAATPRPTGARVVAAAAAADVAAAGNDTNTAATSTGLGFASHHIAALEAAVSHFPPRTYALSASTRSSDPCPHHARQCLQGLCKHECCPSLATLAAARSGHSARATDFEVASASTPPRVVDHDPPPVEAGDVRMPAAAEVHRRSAESAFGEVNFVRRMRSRLAGSLALLTTDRAPGAAAHTTHAPTMPPAVGNFRSSPLASFQPPDMRGGSSTGTSARGATRSLACVWDPLATDLSDSPPHDHGQPLQVGMRRHEQQPYAPAGIDGYDRMTRYDDD